MVNVVKLAKKAMEYKEKGLTDREIGDELHVTVDTVRYLLEEGAEGTLPPTDVKIGWRSLGVFGNRIGLMSEIMADIILEEIGKRDIEVEGVVGIAINGVSFATIISEIMETELVVYRPPSERGKKGGGAFSSNYASVEGKKVVIVDDVLSTGATVDEAINDTKAAGGDPVLVVVIVNKSSLNEVDGVPLRGIIRARSMGGTILGGGPLHSFPYG